MLPSALRTQREDQNPFHVTSIERLSFPYSHPDSSRSVSGENRLSWLLQFLRPGIHLPLPHLYFWLSDILLYNLKHLKNDLNITANGLGYLLILSFLCSVLQSLQFSFLERKEIFSPVFL